MAKSSKQPTEIDVFRKQLASAPAWMLAQSPQLKEMQTRVTIADLAKQLSPESQAPVRATVGAALALPAGPQRDSLFAQILTGLPQLVIQEAQSKATTSALPSSNTDELANWLAQQAQSTHALGQAQAAGINAIIPNVPAAYQPMLQYDALNRATSADQMAGSLVTSYRAQPLVQAFQAQIAAMGGNSLSPSLSGLGQSPTTTAPKQSSLYGSLTG